MSRLDGNYRIEGYWFEEPYSKYSKPSPHPMPIRDVLTEIEARKIFDLIRVKELLATEHCYRGFSQSRITGESLGNCEYELDDWIWPEDFSTHYVFTHRVKPTDDFLKFIGYLK